MISVCMATFQGEAFIEEQLTSILSQLDLQDEIVVSDDGSSDGTVAAVTRINDPRIVWAGTSGGLGIIKNFERALKHARGEYIFLADQDDVWLPGKVKQCVAALQSHLLVVTDCKVVDSQLNEINYSFFHLRNSGSGLLRNLWRNSYLGCCMAFRKELLKYALPFPRSIPMHDMWLGMIAEIIGKVDFMASPLLLYRRHAQNASDTAGKSTASIGKMLTNRIALAALVLMRVTTNIFGKLK